MQLQLNIKFKAIDIIKKFLLHASLCLETWPKTLLLIRDSQSHLKWLCKMHKVTLPLAIVEEARIGKADGYDFKMT